MNKRVALIFLMVLPAIVFSQNRDIRLLRAINSPETLSSDRFFQFASNSDVYLVIGIPVAMAATGLIKNDDNLVRNACVTIAATALNFSVTAILKYSIDRERPFLTYPDIAKKSDAGSPSFPSGHTSSSFATATSLSLAYPKWYIIIPAYTWAGTVAYSRMYLGVHYPSDVLAGAAIGAGSAWISYTVNKKLNVCLSKKHR